MFAFSLLYNKYDSDIAYVYIYIDNVTILSSTQSMVVF